MSLLHTLRLAARRAGFEVTRYAPQHSPHARLARMLAHHGVDCVLDVGAHTGGYAETLRAAGYGGTIVSFEPQPEVHQTLCVKARRDALWYVAEPMALGEREGTADLHVAGNSTSSSLLPMLDTHVAAAPQSATVVRTTVPLRRLDGVAHPALTAARAPFLKVDTQGYEAQVLAGAAGLLPRLVGVQIELSFTPLYAGQMLYGALCAQLEAAGFALWAMLPGFTDPATGRMLQADGVFFRGRT